MIVPMVASVTIALVKSTLVKGSASNTLARAWAASSSSNPHSCTANRRLRRSDIPPKAAQKSRTSSGSFRHNPSVKSKSKLSNPASAVKVSTNSSSSMKAWDMSTVSFRSWGALPSEATAIPPWSHRRNPSVSSSRLVILSHMPRKRRTSVSSSLSGCKWRSRHRNAGTRASAAQYATALFERPSPMRRVNLCRLAMLASPLERACQRSSAKWELGVETSVSSARAGRLWKAAARCWHPSTLMYSSSWKSRVSSRVAWRDRTTWCAASLTASATGCVRPPRSRQAQTSSL
mmetsp:Transcript_51364/g.135436  ORF Transcript_51364/g.135436 Transcript_51364/m.135436 type:complete len:290 (+) Transcript_51364:245-1114(+)